MAAIVFLFVFAFLGHVHAFGVPAGTTQEPNPPFNPAVCAGAFQALGFSPFDFARYSTFFKDDSYATLAQTGSYTGPVDIEEYIRYTTPSSPYFLTQTAVGDQFDLVGYDAAKQTCTFRRYSISQYTTDPIYTAGSVSRTVQAASLQYITYSQVGNYVTSLLIHLQPGWLQWFFEDLLASDKTNTYICNVMKNNCPSTWAAQPVTTIDECKSRLAGLPAAESPGLYVDGDTQGCRKLHGVFASINPDHCNHISFVPRPDPQGRFKCQNSSKTSSAFDSSDVDAFLTWLASYNISDAGFKLL